MAVDALLSRLQGVKKTGPDRWLAKCPSHEDKRPSLSVRELSDGRVLIHDFGGCGTDAVLSSLGLQLGDLFPEKLPADTHATPRAPRIPAGDILQAVVHEIHVVACAGADLERGLALNAADRARLSLAVRRLTTAVQVAHG